MEMNTTLYYQSARTLKMPFTRIPYIGGFEIRLGQQRYFFRSNQTPFNCNSSSDLSSNKFCTNKILEAAGFPIPKADAFSKGEFKREKNTSFMKYFKFPLVVKPTSGSALGKDVLCNVKTMDQLDAYMNKCFRKYKFLTIEEFHPNLNSYRVLVFYNKVIGVVQRYPAHVIGDGVHSIQALINQANVIRKKLKKTTSLGPIKVDEEMHIRLKELKLTLESIPKDKEMVVLLYTCNSTRGGTMESLGKKICKENAKLLCKAAQTLNLNLVGFDVLCEDILIPIEKSRGVIIEANHSPDVSIHEHPLTGSKNLVTQRILWRLILKHPIAYCLRPHQSITRLIYLKLVLAIAILYGSLSLISSIS